MYSWYNRANHLLLHVLMALFLHTFVACDELPAETLACRVSVDNLSTQTAHALSISSIYKVYLLSVHLSRTVPVCLFFLRNKLRTITCLSVSDSGIIWNKESV